MTNTKVQVGAAAGSAAAAGVKGAGPAGAASSTATVSGAAGPGVTGAEAAASGRAVASGAAMAGTATTGTAMTGAETSATGQRTSTVGRIRKAAGPASAGSLGGIGLVLAGVLSVQFGSAAAALLFPRAGALGVVALRVTIAAVLLLVACRPRLRGYSRTDWGVVGAFGLALGGMNVLFYQAIDRIPLGPAVTLEVLGPLLLSVVTARRAASLVWAGMAFAGVFLLGQGSFGELSLAGAGFALGAGAMWAAYIVFSARAGARFPRLDGLALAMAVAALVSLPLGIGSAGATLLEPKVLGIGLVVALLSSGVPYTLELLALRRLPAGTFAVLMSLAPAVAALAGFLVLGQTLSALQCAAIALVVGASAGAVRAGGAGRK